MKKNYMYVHDYVHNLESLTLGGRRPNLIFLFFICEFINFKYSIYYMQKVRRRERT